MQIVARVAELAKKYGVQMQEIALSWQWAKGVASPIVGATKSRYLNDAAAALDVKLTDEDVAYLEEPYLPHRIVGAIDRNPSQGVFLLDEKIKSPMYRTEKTPTFCLPKEIHLRPIKTHLREKLSPTAPSRRKCRRISRLPVGRRLRTKQPLLLLLKALRTQAI